MSARQVTRRASLHAICAMVLLLDTSGCMTWKAASIPDGSHDHGSATFDRARIVLLDSTRVELRYVVVGSDSVIGYTGENRTRMAFAHAQVARVETRGVSIGRTGAVAGGVVAVVALVALIAVARALSQFNAAPSTLPSAH
jgi:hypothetical protein